MYFPEKSVKLNTFDKDWMHPDLKILYIEMTKEYYKNRKSEKWKRLYVKFRRSKRKAVRGRNQNQFADKLIEGSRSNFYRQVRKVGGLKDKNKKLLIASLEGKSDLECAQAIGRSTRPSPRPTPRSTWPPCPPTSPPSCPPRWGRWKSGENLEN
jgi:hypothetical protein